MPVWVCVTDNCFTEQIFIYFHRLRKQLTYGEKACEELLDLLEDKQADPVRVQEKMAVLSRIRKVALERLPEAQEKLRKVMNDRQQGIMAVMGYLN